MTVEFFESKKEKYVITISCFNRCGRDKAVEALTRRVERACWDDLQEVMVEKIVKRR